jgi:hypothetical protein
MIYGEGGMNGRVISMAMSEASRRSHQSKQKPPADAPHAVQRELAQCYENSWRSGAGGNSGGYAVCPYRRDEMRRL